MNLTQIIATSIVVLIGLAIFTWADKQTPEEPDETEADRVRRYLAQKDGDEE